jgi:peptidoglycan/LPS O-acetylase OafA/YrhL
VIRLTPPVAGLQPGALRSECGQSDSRCAMPAASETRAPSRDPHLPALTGLRGLAAGLVALLHLWHFAGQPAWRLGPWDLGPLPAGGYLGVDLFFVLSGFLLGLPFIRARMRSRATPALGGFWIRRARRVLPALWVQLAILYCAGWIVAGSAPANLLQLLAQATLTFNLFDSATLNAVYWSLPVEWDFYVVLPLLALLFARGSGRPWGLPLVLLLVLAVRIGCVLAVREWGLDGIPYARWIIQLPARLDQFFLGMVAAWLVLRLAPAPRAGLWLAWSGLAAMLALMWHTAPLGDVITHLKTPHVYWHFTLAGAAFALLVAGAALGAGRGLGTLLSSRPFGFLGRISYSLYLWHYPVLEALRWLGWPQGWGATHPLAWWALAIFAMVLVSWLSWRFVERPFQATPRSALAS